MIIGFDAKRAVNNFTGLGNYSRFVIHILSRYYPDLTYRLYAPRQKENPELNKILENGHIKLVYPKTYRAQKFPSWWRTKSICRDLKNDRIDLFHGLSNELPVGIDKTGIKSIVTIHDLIFLRYPQYYPLIDRTIYQAKFRYACRKADRIIAVSECTKRDIVDFYGISPEKIDVIYQGCDPRFAWPVSEEEKKRITRQYGLPERYILNVGSIEERKNLLLLLQALPTTDPDLKLVAVGRKTAYLDKLTDFIRDHGLENRIHFIHRLPHHDLPAVYQQAELFVYPSRYEGFGIPIIEAIHSGLPVIAATGSCLVEAGGKGAMYVDPDDFNQLAETINRLSRDHLLREEIVRKGKKHLRLFEEKRLADNIIQTYRKAGLFS